MALSIQLQEIANKSAGVYQLVINNTARARVTPPTTLRLVPLNSRRGPVNSLVYINKQDYAGLESVFGGISSRDERHGNFGIRIARHCLENGPIVVMNLRRFDDTLDKAGLIGMSAVFGKDNTDIQKEAYSKLHNTERLWYPDPEQLGYLNATKESGISFANVGSKKLSIFVRKSTSQGWNMTIKEWYTKKGIEVPEYVDPYAKMIDTFIDVFVFETDFSNAKLNMANENYGYLFTDEGIKAFYTDDQGVDHDPLNELAQIEDAQFVRKYTGSLIDNLVDAANNVASITGLVNAYAPTDGLMMYVNPSIIQSDEILDYDPEISGAKRTFGIDFLGMNRFRLADEFAAIQDRVLIESEDLEEAGELATGENEGIDWSGETEYPIAAWLSHLAQNCVYATSTTSIVHSEEKTLVTIENSDVAGKQVGGRKITCWINPDLKGVTEAYVLDEPRIKTGDYLIGNTSNLVSVQEALAVGTIIDTDSKVEYNMLKIIANEPVMFAESLTNLAKQSRTNITLSDGTVLENVVKTSLYIIYDLNAPMEGESLAPITLVAYTPRSEQFCDGTAARQKDILNLLNEPSLIKGLKVLNEYRFRYVIDPFKTYIEPQVKANLAAFAETLNCRVISSTPFTEAFRRSTNPYFRKTPSTPLEAAYIEKGGNKDLVSSNTFSLPIDGADKIWFFGPGMKNNATGKEVIVPFTGAVGKAFLNKFLDGTMQPYNICANQSGILSVDGMVGTENEWTDEERDCLERMGYNPIITQQNIGVTIYGNQTASQRVLSDLSKIHISELVLTIQEEMRKMLKNYVFKYNNYQYRLEIYTKAEEIMKQIFSNGGVYWWQNVIDTTNNTLEVINNSMGILDTHIVATKGGEKWIHRTYLETGANISGFETMM